MKNIMSIHRVRSSAAVILLALVALPLAAQTASDPSWGFSFPVPAGWKVHQEPAGALLGHDAIAGLITVLPHSAGSLAQVREEMGLAPDPLAAYRASGYYAKVSAEREKAATQGGGYPGA